MTNMTSAIRAQHSRIAKSDHPTTRSMHETLLQMMVEAQRRALPTQIGCSHCGSALPFRSDLFDGQCNPACPECFNQGT